MKNIMEKHPIAKTILSAIGVTVATTIASKAVDAVLEKVQQLREKRKAKNG